MSRYLEVTRISDEASARQYGQLAGARFRGMLESDLKMFDRLGQEGDLLQEVEGLRERVRELERAIGEADIRRRQENALAIIATNAARILPTLDVERPNDPVALAIEDLTLAAYASRARFRTIVGLPCVDYPLRGVFKLYGPLTSAERVQASLEPTTGAALRAGCES